jgi:hypothetical protein
MSIVKTATTLPTQLDDAQDASRARREAVVVGTAQAREPGAPETTLDVSLDAGLEDPYDNIACTD